MDVEWDGMAWHDLRALVFSGLALGTGAKDDFDMTASCQIRWALMSLAFAAGCCGISNTSPISTQLFLRIKAATLFGGFDDTVLLLR